MLHRTIEPTTYYMSYRLELSDSEQRHISSHPEIGKMIIGTGRFGASSPMEITMNVASAVKGMDKAEFATLALQTEFEKSLREGCATLKEHLNRLDQVSGGPTVTEF